MKFKKYSEHELQEMPLTEVAFLYLSSVKKPVSFNKLVDIVFTAVGKSDEERTVQLGKFYTDLTIDGRFVTFSNGKWDLRARHRFEAFDWDEAMELEPLEEDEEEIEVEDVAPIILEEDEFDEDEEKIDVKKIINHAKDEDDFDE